MRRVSRVLFIIVVLAGVVAPPQSSAQQPGIKFRPVTNAIGWDRYVVTLSLQPGEDAGAIAQQLAGTYRGRLEPFARTGFAGFAISMTEASARLLSQDPRVQLVQGVDATPAANAPQEVPVLPSTDSSPAAQHTEPTVTAPSAAIKLQPRANDSGSTWSTGVYSYDGSGNITAAGEQAYTYDRLGRVTGGTAGSGKKQTYTYDRYGNIETVTTGIGSAAMVRKLGVDPDTNQASNSASPYDQYGTYDAAGNVKTWSTLETFDYDGSGMVRQATLDGAKKLYIYSAGDERIATISLGLNNLETDSMWTIRDMSGKVLRRMEKTGAGSGGTWSWKQDYIYRGSQLLASETDGPERTLHFHPDHLGTPRLITGSGGAKVSLHTYYPFGEEATVVPHAIERLKFTGHERDTPRLDYMHARYYSPVWGRFLSVDPARYSAKAALPQTWNRYVYALNNPAALIDPDGRAVQTTVNRTPAGWHIGMILTIEVSARGQRVVRGAQVREWIQTAQAVFAAKGVGVSTSLKVDAIFSPDGRTDATRHQVVVDESVTRENVNQVGGSVMNVNHATSGATFAHEVGHFLGLTDQYKDVNGSSVANPGYSTNLMGTGVANSPPQTDLYQSQVNELLASWATGRQNIGVEQTSQSTPCSVGDTCHGQE